MTDEQGRRHDSASEDPGRVVADLVEMAMESQRIFAEFLNQQQAGDATPGVDPLNLGPAFAEAAAKFWSNPAQVMQAQADLWQRYLQLWQHTTARTLGHPVEPVAQPERGDRRFRDEAWTEIPQFDFIKQSYLVTAQWLMETVQRLDGLDPATQRKVEFYTKQFADAVAPSNFLLTNPTALRATIESGGRNLVDGLQNLVEDIQSGRPTPKMVDPDAFEVGRDIASTPGKVIAQSDLMQLIQYEPRTEQVYRQPLLIVPPWINKYYILDLRPENSFIRWALDQGYTVFVISWVNPDERLAEKSFADYAFEGPLFALTAIEQAIGEREVSAIGYCIGGTLMSAVLAYLGARDDARIGNCTFFASQVDFTEAGDLAVFIDEEQLQYLERRMEEQGGYLDADAMFTTFNLLRSNDLIWSYVVNNYLLGKEPPPFDLLYWNQDTTNLPAAMHRYYLRNMYQRNLLVQPGALELGETPIDLGNVRIPAYLQAAEDDHIAPARSVFKTTQHFRGPCRFVLAGSGHVAGVINPPAVNKYYHWVNEQERPYESLDEWLADAEQRPGSWWPDWDAWLRPQSGEQVPARIPGQGGLAAIEDAPGTFARMQYERKSGA